MVRRWDFHSLVARLCLLTLLMVQAEKHQIVDQQQAQSRKEENDSPGTCISVQELSDHPDGISQNPDTDSQVMEELGAYAAGLPEYIDGHGKSRQDHKHACQLPFQSPAGIFDQPEENMTVLDPAVTGIISLMLPGAPFHFLRY